MARKFRRARGAHPELDITAFLNLMVVLVPFLLITAVFSQLSILELNLPSQASDDPAEPPKPVLALEVIVRAESLVVNDRNTGPLQRLPAVEGGLDWDGLTRKLREVKGRFADVTAVSVLVEPDIPYAILVRAMDTVRIYRERTDEGIKDYELFPDISIGDAPKEAGR